MNLNYRPDVDGLRAVAVLGVVLYHLGLPWIGGGFAGVDIFFVISGYLITGIISREIDLGRFTFAGFYERRIRRILPAFAALLAACTAAASILLLPSGLMDFSAASNAALALSSNLWFWRNTGYFSPEAASHPLLHLWSLSVEEQFYLLFPVLLLIVFRYARSKAPWVLLALGLLSLALSALVLPLRPQAVFYLPPFRAWELLAGGLLALAPLPQPGRLLREILSLGGLALIAVTFFGYSDLTPFPGLSALLPCGGAALLIYSAKDSWTGKGLAWPPVVFVGLISYSLYLWHWPLIVFTRLALHRPLLPMDRLALFVFSFACAVLSWRFIERPFRKPSNPVARPVLFAGTLILVAGFMGLNLWIGAKRGLPQRFDPFIVALDREQHPAIPFRECASEPLAMLKEHPCEFGDVHQRTTTVLIWGDSHSLAALPAFDSVLKLENRKGVNATVERCPPLLGIENVDRHPAVRNACLDFNNSVLRYLDAHPDIREVILVASWGAYSHDSSDYVLTDPRTGERGNRRLLPDALRNTVSQLQGRGIHVALLTQVPLVGWKVPEGMLLAYRYGQALPAASTRAQYHRQTEGMRRAIASAQAASPFQVVDLEPLFFAGDTLDFARDGLPLYRDDNHLNARGAAFIVPALRAVFTARVTK